MDRIIMTTYSFFYPLDTQSNRNNNCLNLFNIWTTIQQVTLVTLHKYRPKINILQWRRTIVLYSCPVIVWLCAGQLEEIAPGFMDLKREGEGRKKTKQNVSNINLTY